MNKLQFVAAIMAFFVFGCSDRMNPVEPAQTSIGEATPVVSVDPPLALSGKSSSGSKLAGTESMDLIPSTVITVAKPVVAKDGGTVRLNGSFINSVGETVTYDLSVTFAPGALPSNQTITISIDKTTFADNADVTFGPAGLVFAKPAKLYLWGANVDVAKKSTSVILQYWNGTRWEPYPNSWGFYNSNFSGIVFASGDIPHFSRYAFGR